MKKLLFFLLLSPLASYAQQSIDLTTEHATEFNGIEYGFDITNERKTEIKNENYNRFELRVYVRNNSGCSKILFPRQTTFGEQNQNLLAAFLCVNATGKRLTSKDAQVHAGPFVIPYKQTVKNAEGKMITTTTNIQVGHILKNGEISLENLIVIVPEGEAPRIKVVIQDLIEL